ncbi:uncharacterized protein LOC133547930 isoform X2 [Nerophis ophidion]|uniref:uncharacterized protein LOC133547930 isoform X2 n=1 Tax=Nerophis ophidion TaxID=159077 RepID=UPI002ADFC696|nr:uncharacterized protein LOC133547930 isoform X2 [Nerophis ophidion]
MWVCVFGDIVQMVHSSWAHPDADCVSFWDVEDCGDVFERVCCFGNTCEGPCDAAAAVHHPKRGVSESEDRVSGPVHHSKRGVSGSEEEVSESDQPDVLALPLFRMICGAVVGSIPPDNPHDQNDGNPPFCVVLQTPLGVVGGASASIGLGSTPRHHIRPFSSRCRNIVAGLQRGGRGLRCWTERKEGMSTVTSPLYHAMEVYWYVCIVSSHPKVSILCVLCVMNIRDVCRCIWI